MGVAGWRRQAAHQIAVENRERMLHHAARTRVVCGQTNEGRMPCLSHRCQPRATCTTATRRHVTWIADGLQGDWPFRRTAHHHLVHNRRFGSYRPSHEWDHLAVQDNHGTWAPAVLKPPRSIEQVCFETALAGPGSSHTLLEQRDKPDLHRPVQNTVVTGVVVQTRVIERKFVVSCITVHVPTVTDGQKTTNTRHFYPPRGRRYADGRRIERSSCVL